MESDLGSKAGSRSCFSSLGCGCTRPVLQTQAWVWETMRRTRTQTFTCEMAFEMEAGLAGKPSFHTVSREGGTLSLAPDEGWKLSNMHLYSQDFPLCGSGF